MIIDHFSYIHINNFPIAFVFHSFHEMINEIIAFCYANEPYKVIMTCNRSIKPTHFELSIISISIKI